jgi:twitching motility protein PilT
VAQIDELLTYLKDNDCSDLHLAAGLEPRVRAKGKVRVIEDRGPLDHQEVIELLKEIATPKHWDEYISTHDVDFAYGLEGVARYRANYFHQQNGAGAVFRIIPEEIICSASM